MTISFPSKLIAASLLLIAALSAGSLALSAKKDFFEELAEARKEAETIQTLAEEAERFRQTALTGDFRTMQNNLFFSVERLADAARNARGAARTLKKAWKKAAPASCAETAEEDLGELIEELEEMAELAQTAADAVRQDARARLTQQQFQDDGHGTPSAQTALLRGYADQLLLPVKELKTRAPALGPMFETVKKACKPE